MLLTTDLAVDYLTDLGIRLSRSTLEDWRSQFRGPPWSKFGGRVYYTVEDLEAWVQAQIAESRRDPSIHTSSSGGTR